MCIFMRNEELAEDNYEDIKKVTPMLRATLDFLLKRYREDAEQQN